MKRLNLKVLVKDCIYSWINGLPSGEVVRMLTCMHALYKSGLLAEPVGISNSDVPVEKGLSGEKHVFNILASKYKVENCSKQPRSGDMNVFYGGKVYMVEVKNYKNKVPMIEMTKFNRDIVVRTPDAAVIICINSVMTKYEEKYNFVYHNNILCLIINSKNESEILLGIDMLIQLSNETNMVEENDVDACDSERDELCELMKEMKIMIEESKRIEKLKTNKRINNVAEYLGKISLIREKIRTNIESSNKINMDLLDQLAKYEADILKMI